MNDTRPYPWKVFWLLVCGGLAGVAAVMPYLFAVFGKTMTQGPVKLPVLVALQLLQSALLLSVAVGVGLLLSRKIGLGAPFLEAWLYKRKPPARNRTFLWSIVAGAAVGIGIVLLVHLVFLPLVPQLPLAMEAAIPLWKRFLACFYGGIDEEIISRLFLLSLLLWLLAKVWHNAEALPSRGAFWTANLATALLFGLGHVPAAKLIMPITPVVIVCILLLNGIAAVVFGYLYWKRGLEAAIVAHFSADIVLHVIAPTFFQGASA